MVGESVVWCPNCGAEYVRGRAERCADCRVLLVDERPTAAPALSGDELMEMGEWPRLPAQILRRRLETAGVSVMVEWVGVGADSLGTIVVPAEQADFAYSVIQELSPEEEVPDTSPGEYVARIEEHLEAASALLEQLRTRLEAGDG